MPGRIVAPNQSKKSRETLTARRARLRKQGLLLIEIWMPDVRSPAFAAEAHRQSLAVARSRQEKDDLDFIDAVSDWNYE